MRAPRAGPATAGHPRRSCVSGDRSTSSGSGARLDARLMAFRAIAFHERAIFTDQQLEVLALFFRELEKDLLAFGILEPFAIALEETMRAALAADADAVGLEIVHAVAAQLFG